MRSCLNCHKMEQEIPLVTLQYQGQPAYICSQCFPILIHTPAKLTGKINDAEKIQPADHDH